MELMIPLDNQGTTPMYEQIYHYIKEEIRMGSLKAGSRLPSTRVLADHLKVSRRAKCACQTSMRSDASDDQGCKWCCQSVCQTSMRSGAPDSRAFRINARKPVRHAP